MLHDRAPSRSSATRSKGGGPSAVHLGDASAAEWSLAQIIRLWWQIMPLPRLFLLYVCYHKSLPSII